MPIQRTRHDVVSCYIFLALAPKPTGHVEVGVEALLTARLGNVGLHGTVEADAAITVVTRDTEISRWTAHIASNQGAIDVS